MIFCGNSTKLNFGSKLRDEKWRKLFMMKTTKGKRALINMALALAVTIQRQLSM